MNESLQEDIHTNYNEVGAEIIQKLFGVGYLSPRGETATDQLAKLVTLTESTQLLDVGSGLGGPAVRLAEVYGCHVTGLDLVETSVETATKIAKKEGLSDLVEFHQGDATNMPFADDRFDMVWGQDAWCHVPNRSAVFGECARVLKPGGTIVFADWLLTGPEDETYRRDVLPAMACPSYETLSGYRGYLERHGFIDIRTEDMSADYESHYKLAMTRLEQAKDWIIERYSTKVYAIVLEKNGFALEAFKKGQLGGGNFLARLPDVKTS